MVATYQPLADGKLQFFSLPLCMQNDNYFNLLIISLCLSFSFCSSFYRGSEWPSWLAVASFGEKRRLSHGTQPNDVGVCRNQLVSGNVNVSLKPSSQAGSKWPSLPSNRCRVNVVDTETPSPSPPLPSDMVTADEDLANQLQFLLKTKWTIDKDTYNSDAFDQCEGAWPIAHPLPLPLWSNTIKQPFIVDNVSNNFVVVFFSDWTRLNSQFNRVDSSLFSLSVDLAIWRPRWVNWCHSTSIAGGDPLQYR